ncbi:MAG: hypothetical protein SNF93_04745 [Rikenellaceae bacterium]
MKYILSIIACFVATHILFAQEIKVDTIYYDEEWKLVSSKYIADYYRIKVDSQKSNDRQFRDYYITGEQQSKGRYIYIDSLDNANSIFDGQCIEFYKNGNIKSKKTYVDGKLSGEYFEYKPNGLVNMHASLINGKLNGIVTKFDDDNNCTQIEYVYDIPSDHYTISNKEGCIMTYQTSNNEPIWLTPNTEDIKHEYNDGVEWQYYVKNGLTICISTSQVKDYGKYYRVELLISNNSMIPIEFDPMVNMSIYAIDNYGNVTDSNILSSNDYMKKVTNRQIWNSLLVGVSEGLAAANAGYSTSTTYTTSNVSVRNTYGSYSGLSTTVSTTKQYDATAAYQAQVIASNRVDNFNAAQLAEREVRNDGYFKRSTIYPTEAVSGYILIDRKASVYAAKLNININGAEYIFGISKSLAHVEQLITQREVVNTQHEPISTDTILLRSYAKDQFTYKIKQEKSQIISIDIYNKYTLVTLNCKDVSSKTEVCSINPKTKLIYYAEDGSNPSGYFKSANMVKVEDKSPASSEYPLEIMGEDLIIQLYFDPISVKTESLEIKGKRKDEMRWMDIRLRKE